MMGASNTRWELIGYTIEEAEGTHEWTGETIEWRKPGESKLHVEVEFLDLKVQRGREQERSPRY